MPTSADLLARQGMLADPGDHFKGRFEVEQKFAVDDLSPVRQTLADMKAVAFTLGNAEVDVFFDHPDGQLAQNGQVQVLRHMQPSGRVLWISKGPQPDECVAMDLSDFDQATAMLRSIGFIETTSIQKKRDIYFWNDLHITLDDVASLGTFVELAIMTDDEKRLASLDQKLSRAAAQLGLRGESREKRSYRQMLSG